MEFFTSFLKLNHIILYVATKDLIHILSQIRDLSSEKIYDYTMFFEKPEVLESSQVASIRKDLGEAVDELQKLKPSFAKELKSALGKGSGLLTKEAYEGVIRSNFKSHVKKKILDELKRKPFPDSDTKFNFPHFDITGWSGLEVIVEPRRYKKSILDPASAPKVEVKAAITLKNNLEIEAVRETENESEYIDKIVSAEQWTAYVKPTMRASYYFDLNSKKIESFKFYNDPELCVPFGKQRSTEEVPEGFFPARAVPLIMWGLGLYLGAAVPIWCLIETGTAEGFLTAPVGVVLCAIGRHLNKKYRKQDKRKLGSVIAHEHRERKVAL